jgi:phosphoribosyl-AMP cyclohydrolase / phosphoribosyl-ATP pyrophosphohydrolase
MTPNFQRSDELLPVIIQDCLTLQVLMLGYMNQEAFDKTKAEGVVTFFSRSKNRLWKKGETSGNTLLVKNMISDCDNDTILILAEPNGPTCHTGKTSCFDNEQSKTFLHLLEQIIHQKINNNASESYTNQLFKKGINKIAQKVGEEAVELIIEAKDNNDILFLNEAADLLYHYLILLRIKHFKLSDVEKVLEERAS